MAAYVPFHLSMAQLQHRDGLTGQACYYSSPLRAVSESG